MISYSRRLKFRIIHIGSTLAADLIIKNDYINITHSLELILHLKYQSTY